MRALILFGSPRKNGNTATLLKPVKEELSAAGIDISYFDVYKKSIRGCTACLACQKDQDYICCVIDDDMREILQELVQSDVIIIAAPIYAWSIPAPMKAVIDRMIYSTCKYYGDNPNGKALMQGKILYLITTCGYQVEKGADLYIETMKRYCKHCGLTYGCALAKRHRNLNESFMSDDKEARARKFSREIINQHSHE